MNNQPFLRLVAQDILQKNEGDIQRVAVVFPGERAGLFFKKHLVEIADKPLWSPQIFTIDRFFNHHSNPTIPDRLTLIFELYQVYSKFLPQESFDQFHFWGEMLLNDFNEVDRYLVKADRLFRHLKDQKELDAIYADLGDHEKKVIGNFWKNLAESRDSDQKSNFLKLWHSLPSIYQEFKKRLEEKGWNYDGMAQRKTIRKLTDHGTGNEFEAVAFVGFNALTTTEKALFRIYKQHKIGHFYWDADDWYLHHIKNHEAGKFLRDNLERFPNALKKVQTDTIREQKKITLLGAPTDTALAASAGQLTQEWRQQDLDMTKTALVLPDEHLLFPVLNNIPKNVEQVNVTMGYPLATTHLYHLLALLLELHERKIETKSQLIFPHDTVLKLLRHPLVRFQVRDVQKLIAPIEKKNQLFIPANELEGRHPLFSKIFIAAPDIISWTDQVLDLLHHLFIRQKEELKGQGEHQLLLEQELTYQLYKQIKRFRELVKEQAIPLGQEIFKKLLLQVARQVRVPFTGEPLNGLQIMGVLETRTLDFERVVVMSMNEGAFPAAAPHGSFIPVNLRKGFGMPSPDHQDAISSYYFYRLLQRSKEVVLMYNTTISTNVGEHSRFLQQLRYELPFKLDEKILSPPIKGRAAQPIKVEKTRQMTEYFLGKYSREKPEQGNYRKGSLSPSALNSYINCKLRFYLEYIAGLREPEKASDEVDAGVFGSILHKAMENLYKPYVGKEIQEFSMQEIIARVETETEAALREELKQEKVYQIKGHHLLIKEVVVHFAKKVLEIDKKSMPFQIIALEGNRKNGFKFDLPVQADNELLHFRMGGYIDRIDQLQDGTVRLIDYKTGKDERGFKSVDELFDQETKSRNKAAFQTLYYNLLLRGNPKYTRGDFKVQAGLYNLKDLFSPNFDFRLVENNQPIDDLNLYKDIFQEKLQGLLKEMLDPVVHFEQTEDTSLCSYCPFKVMCHRD